MTRRARITLTDHFARFIDEQVASGRYGSPDEVVVDGLRLVEERERRLRALNAAIDEGLASGVDEDFSWNAVREQGRRIARERSG